MEELKVNEMHDVSGGILLEIALGFAFGAICGATAGAIANKVCDMF